MTACDPKATFELGFELYFFQHSYRHERGTIRCIECNLKRLYSLFYDADSVIFPAEVDVGCQ